VRLGRALGVEPAELEFLAPVGADALREVRALVLDRLYAGEDEQLHRIAAASRLVPNTLNAHITPKAVPPMLAAALVPAMEPPRAVAIASRMPAHYLAEAASMMDPRRIGRFVPALPLELIIRVTRELMDRKEFVAMGSLAPLLSDEKILGLLPALTDAELLRLALNVEQKDQLDRLATVIHDRLPGVVRAAHDEGLVEETRDMVEHFGPENRALVERLLE